ncbi:hypothetical protein [Colwellia psychrerythraea]|uniref:PEP motif anchor domain protein n=1 Tax=Colwellia psychrerythraea TaxID=28229 RepID=A0A099K8R6_COLPS|nr:hypothetical protein [Colwellia psychrerythraea]KGJ86482.1 hypothetical protein GAB14E_0755 [Colwellia psychrerythraea]
MNIKMLKSTITGLAFLISGVANSGVIYDFDLVYDGSTFSFENNVSWHNLNFNVGDSLDITLKADQGDHWQWLLGSNERYAWIRDSCNSNTGLSEWEFSNNSSIVGSGSQNTSQGCIHFGPNTLNLANGTLFDQYQFNYTYTSGPNTVLSTQDILNNSPWGWTFNDGVRFQYVDANINEISEPLPLTILALGIIALASRRYKTQSN